MRFRILSLTVLIASIAVLAFAQQKQPPPSKNAKPPATNFFAIHLQIGFDGKTDVLVMVDGHEAYRGKPKTTEKLGLAKVISVLSNTNRPTVTFSMPARRIKWSKQIDLRAGKALGLGVEANGRVRMLQAKRFDYD
jgi:hypothetical protein